MEQTDATPLNIIPQRAGYSNTNAIQNSKNAAAALDDSDWENEFKLSEKIQLENENLRYESKKTKVLLINHEKFEKPNIADRDGSTNDQTDLKEKFQKFGFTVESYPDPDNTEEESKKINWEKIKEYVGNFLKDIEDFDSIIVVISSHGYLRRLISYDGEYEIDNFLKLFEEKLKGKPKLFFVNACRIEDNNKPGKNDDYFPKLVLNDCVLVYSAYPGKYSYRTGKGGRMLRSLRIALDKIKQDKIGEVYVLDFLTDIKKHVGTKPVDDQKQMPYVSYNITKNFFINFNQNA